MKRAYERCGARPRLPAGVPVGRVGVPVGRVGVPVARAGGAIGSAGVSVSARRRQVRRLALIVAALVTLWVPLAVSACGAGTATAPNVPTAAATVPTAATQTPSSGLPTIPVSALPPEARHVLALVDAGGPFPYHQDGTIFQNAEGLLPRHDSGYYREYTVPTPGASDRGARRLVVGRSGDVYYTADHYASFRQVLR